MSRILITGFSGFVSYHYLNFLEENQITTYVIGVDRSIPQFDFKIYKNIICEFHSIDLLNFDEVSDLINEKSIEMVLHLASFSSVSKSWEAPAKSFINNTNIFLNLLEIIRIQHKKIRILSIGSSEEYGEVPLANLPLTENSNLSPRSPYAVARVSQEFLSHVYVKGYNLDIILTRSFNHIGTHQNNNFAIPSIANQILTAAKSNNEIETIKTGNYNIIRDFVDVRDVVKAYYLLFKYGAKGEIYNICSGKGYSLKEMIEKMVSIVKINYNLEIDPNLVRPYDNPIVIGSYSKIHKICGWKPEIDIEISLKDILNYYRNNESTL